MSDDNLEEILRPFMHKFQPAHWADLREAAAAAFAAGALSTVATPVEPTPHADDKPSRPPPKPSRFPKGDAA